MLASSKEFHTNKASEWQRKQKLKEKTNKKTEEEAFFNWSFSHIYAEISMCLVPKNKNAQVRKIPMQRLFLWKLSRKTAPAWKL